MKRRIIQIILAVASAGVFSACTSNDKTGRPDNGDEGVFVEMYASVVDQDGTRANITIGDSKFSGEWEGGDQLGITYINPVSPISNFTNLTYNTDTKSFGGTITGTNGLWKYYAFYPNVEGSESNTANAPFGSGRWQNGAKYNSAYDVMASDEVTCTASDPGKTPAGDPVMFNMNRLTSILAFSLSSSSADVSGAKVKSVKITADKPIAAKTLNFKYDMVGKFDAAKAYIRLDDASQSNSILLTYEDGTQPSVADFKAFFNILPGNYTLKVDVLTDNNKMASFNVNRSDAGKPFVAGKLYKKSETLSTWTNATFPVPALTWEDHNFAVRYELTEGLPVNIITNSEAGIAKFEIDITSPALVDLLPAVGLATHMDLVNPTDDAMSEMLKNLGFPIKDEVRNNTNLSLDITALMGMLYGILESDPVTSNHDFKLTITDNAGKSTAATVQLKYTAPSPIEYADDADLWNNTASFSIKPTTTVALNQISVEYKRSTESTWQTATVTANGDGRYKAVIEPQWGEDQNIAGNKILTIDKNTGVWANTTYNVRLKIDDTQNDITFTTDSGDTLPNAGMEDWSEKAAPDNTTKTVWSPNLSKDNLFWANGNNQYMFGITGGATAKLCLQGTYTGMGGNACAALSGQSAVGVFAAGNLFTGIFEMEKTKGYARFGQKYNFTARPSALKLKYAASPSVLAKVNNDAPAAVGDIDKGRIFVCIVEWSDRHTVQSGLQLDKNSFWNPDVVSSLAEGKIIGYGATYITTNQTGQMKDLELPIVYYEKTNTAPTGNYTLVISCATSFLVDYLTGSTDSKLWVDDFQWVY